MTTKPETIVFLESALAKAATELLRLRERAEKAEQALRDAKPVAPVEVWKGNRKVTIYQGENIIRSWGVNIETEMSDEPYSLNATQRALDWLYAAPTAVQRSPAQQMPTMATSGSGIAEVDSPAARLESATSVKNTLLFSSVAAGAPQQSEPEADAIAAPTAVQQEDK